MKRNFTRKLDKALSTATPGTNVLTLELGMRGKVTNNVINDIPSTGPCNWVMITDPGQAPYYFNKVTGESTYERPEEFNRVLPPPPPPPPQKLPGMAPPPPPPKPADQQPVVPAEPEPELEPHYEPEQQPEHEQAQEYQETSTQPKGWVYVCINEPNPYYWNISTNETSFEQPEDFDGTIYNEDLSNTSYTESNDYSSVITWQELYTENGEVYYSNLVDGSVSYERPMGTTFIQVIAEDGTQVDWQYCADEEGNGYYHNLVSNETTIEPPMGTTLIVVDNQTQE